MTPIFPFPRPALGARPEGNLAYIIWNEFRSGNMILTNEREQFGTHGAYMADFGIYIHPDYLLAIVRSYSGYQNWTREQLESGLIDNELAFYEADGEDILINRFPYAESNLEAYLLNLAALFTGSIEFPPNLNEDVCRQYMPYV